MANWLLFRHYLLKPSLQYCQKWSKVEWTQLKWLLHDEKQPNKCPLVSINSLTVPMSWEEQEARGIHTEYCQYSIRKSRRTLYNKTKTNSFNHTLNKRISCNKTQKFLFSATKCEAPLLNICLPADLLVFSFLPLFHSHKSLCTQAGWYSKQISCCLQRNFRSLFPSHLLFKYTLICSESILVSEGQYLPRVP